MQVYQVKQALLVKIKGYEDNKYNLVYYYKDFL
jgi:hypothetical protein